MYDFNMIDVKSQRFCGKKYFEVVLRNNAKTSSEKMSAQGHTFQGGFAVYVTLHFLSGIRYLTGLIQRHRLELFFERTFRNAQHTLKGSSAGFCISFGCNFVFSVCENIEFYLWFRS